MQNEVIAVIESEEPSIEVDVRKIGDKGLDEGISILLVESKGPADRDLLANLLVERHYRARADESGAWLKDCESLWLLATEVYTDERGETLPLWTKFVPDGTWTWGSFALDILQMPASTATARKRIWEVYRKRLCWTPEVLARIGPSRLGVAVAEVERSLDDGQSDDELEGLLLGDGSGRDNAEWKEVWMHVQEKGDERRRLAGKPVRVKLEPKFVLDEATGESLSFELTSWYNDLIYQLGTFTWNVKLPEDVKVILEGALMDALRRGPRRL